MYKCIVALNDSKNHAGVRLGLIDELYGIKFFQRWKIKFQLK